MRKTHPTLPFVLDSDSDLIQEKAKINHPDTEQCWCLQSKWDKYCEQISMVKRLTVMENGYFIISDGQILLIPLISPWKWTQPMVLGSDTFLSNSNMFMSLFFFCETSNSFNKSVSSFYMSHVKWDVSFRWPIRPNSAWGYIESTTVRKKHRTFISVLFFS